MDHEDQPLQRIRHARLIKTIHRNDESAPVARNEPSLLKLAQLALCCRPRHCEVTRKPCDPHGPPFDLSEEDRSQYGHKLPCVGEALSLPKVAPWIKRSTSLKKRER